MKKLKYFESTEYSFEDDYHIHYGITPEELIYFFTDIIDEGWIVRTRFLKKLYNLGEKEENKNEFTLGLIPYISVTITKNWPRFEVSIYNANNQLNDLINSEEYKNILQVISDRLSDIDMYIHKQSIENKQLNILIYRKTDKNYVQ